MNEGDGSVDTSVVEDAIPKSQSNVLISGLVELFLKLTVKPSHEMFMGSRSAPAILQSAIFR